MNIKQIKEDLENGILVSKVTLLKLADAALIYERALITISDNSDESGSYSCADDAIDKVRELKK